MSDEPKICDAEAGGYDGMFGVYCDLPSGHEGLHCDGFVEWQFVERDYTPRGRVRSEQHRCMRATQR